MIRKLLLAAALLLPTTARAAWHEATSNHFIVYSEGSEQEARDFAAKLERFNFVLRTMRPPPNPNAPSLRLRVFLVRNQNAVQQLSGPGVAGYYVSDARGLMLVGTRQREGMSSDIRSNRNIVNLDPESVLFHEYTHHYTFQYFPAAYPVWYSEGYAEFWGSTRILDNDVVEVGAPANHRFQTFSDLGWLPLNRVLSAHNYSEAPGENVFLLYAEGWLIVRYLFDHPDRQRQVNEYLRLVNLGVDFSEAARRAIPDMGAFDSALNAYSGAARFGVVRLPFRTIDVGPIAVRALRPAEDALLLDEIRVSQGYRQREATQFAAEVRGRAGRFPDDPFAIRLIMETQFLAGNNAEALAAADRLLALEPANARALMTKGLVQMAGLVAARSTDQNSWNATRQFLTRAVNAARQDPVVLSAYYHSFRMQNVVAPEGAQNALYDAMELAPSDDEIRYVLARDYESRNMIPEAIAIIRPVAYQVPYRANESEGERRTRRERETRDRQAGREWHENAREMLVRLEARAQAAAPAR
jgi:tetratricopeptide (TPR) repeat protein